MSDTDSFIDEVTEEVRRDRLFALMKKYGWIAVLAVVLIVGGAGFVEWRKAQDRATAEATGDAMIAALKIDAPEDRAAALQDITVERSGGQAVLALLEAGEQIEAGEFDAAAAALQKVAGDSGLPLIYRQLAEFKLLSLKSSEMSEDDLRAGYQGLVGPSSQLTLLAEEQLALLDIKAGDTKAAGERLTRIAADPNATSGLRRRATELMVALGVTPEQGADSAAAEDTATTDENGND
ncbi:tetratricopeptide repeat protein [Rhodalgimonas zhirmunskyi]|uniref:Tetratricopeptide repeat protein n=1 Tax=Rhodalgimonas zhirmunskyi TaxID=2964767 RepID=A0AAJ1X3H7_9RHOB|nr:tetratricopeptide repeat protein [Rhodoalgimonas zhirmunskyi]MDQ2093308.1 tetratricopeptide repeat protein [Rhodoalgimonas zhirmunskyi]